MKEKITVILAEDHRIVRTGLKALIEIEDNITVVDEADNGLEAVQKSQELSPMIIILDIALPVLNGIEAARQIKKLNPSIKILILSAHCEDRYLEKVSALSISGFLMKQCSPESLIKAIREVSRGRTYFSPLITERLEMFSKQSSKKTKMEKNKVEILTSREMQVLQLVAEGKANKQVAGDLEISIKTVEKHRQNLMKKLLIHDTAGLTRYAIAEGIIECGSQKTII